MTVRVGTRPGIPSKVKKVENKVSAGLVPTLVPTGTIEFVSHGAGPCPKKLSTGVAAGGVAVGGPAVVVGGKVALHVTLLTTLSFVHIGMTFATSIGSVTVPAALVTALHVAGPDEETVKDECISVVEKKNAKSGKWKQCLSWTNKLEKEGTAT